MLIPSSKRHATIRRRICYEILSQHVGRLLTQPSSNSRSLDAAPSLDDHFVTQVLNLPVEWITVARALCLQNLNLYELALSQWLKIGNMQQAHSIFHEKILPLYMHRAPTVSMTKALHLGSALTQAERRECIKQQNICPRDAKVEQLVGEFQLASPYIADWDSKTGNFRKFLELLNDLAEKGFSTGDACRSFVAMVKEIQTFSRDDPDDPVDHFIGQEIATIGNFLQMREDEANAIDGQQKHAGVYHYAGGNSFRFQSDAAFVA